LLEDFAAMVGSIGMASSIPRLRATGKRGGQG
jgi:hypothetical protein